MRIYFSDQTGSPGDFVLYPEYVFRDTGACVMLSFSLRAWEGKTGKRKVDPRLVQLIRHRKKRRSKR
jgi:hypothetical protein